MLDYVALRTLHEILSTGSFETAAARLGVTPSAVSQRIRGLEERAGGPLLLRRQPVEATELGRVYLSHAETVTLLEAELEARVGTLPASKRIRVVVNADSFATWVLPALAQVEGLLFEILLDDQDHTEAMLREGAVQAAVTTTREAISGCVAYPLGRLRYIASASPGFRERYFADGVSEASLSVAPLLVFNRKDRLQHDWMTSVTGKRLSPPNHYLPSTTGFVEAAELGLGWGLNPAPLVAEALASGRLCRIHDQDWDTPLTWQVTRAVSQALAPLTRALRRTARERLLPMQD
jgi:LysR family transcriptional regulator (chromosome initiation inhibitor)